MIKRCKVCGCEFVAKRSSALYCSNKCRQKNYRRSGVVLTKELEPIDFDAHISNHDISALVQRAHQFSSDLSRASQYAPYALREPLAASARAIETALRKNGL